MIFNQTILKGSYRFSEYENGSIEHYFNYAYYFGYSGIWSWQANEGGHCSDDFHTQALGLNWLRGRNDQDNGGQVDININ